jgi:hypothetical protein
MLKAALMLTLVAGVAGAQLPEMAAGSRLKVELTTHQKFDATLMSQTGDSLVVAADGARIVKFPTSTVGRIKSTSGKSHGAGAKKGAKIGAFIGAGFGVLAGLLVMEDDGYDDYPFDKSAAPAVFGAIGAAEGALYGVAIGAIVGAQNWKTIYERPYSVSFAPAPGAVRVAIAFRR